MCIRDRVTTECCLRCNKVVDHADRNNPYKHNRDTFVLIQLIAIPENNHCDYGCSAVIRSCCILTIAFFCFVGSGTHGGKNNITCDKNTYDPVSYTHLDVYKRQAYCPPLLL